MTERILDFDLWERKTAEDESTATMEEGRNRRSGCLGEESRRARRGGGVFRQMPAQGCVTGDKGREGGTGDQCCGLRGLLAAGHRNGLAAGGWDIGGNGEAGGIGVLASHGQRGGKAGGVGKSEVAEVEQEQPGGDEQDVDTKPSHAPTITRTRKLFQPDFLNDKCWLVESAERGGGPPPHSSANGMSLLLARWFEFVAGPSFFAVGGSGSNALLGDDVRLFCHVTTSCDF
jgi:hypothetical protein